MNNKCCRQLIVGFLMLGLALSATSQAASPKGASITIRVRGFIVPGNTVKLILMPEMVYSVYELNRHQAFEAQGKDGYYIFHILPFSGLKYFALLTPKDSSANSVVDGLGESGVVEPGDSLMITINKGYTNMGPLKFTSSYRGPGSLKMECWENLTKAAFFTTGTGLLLDSAYRPYSHNWVDIKTNVMLAILQQYNGRISPASYDQLLVDISSMYQGNKMDDLRRQWVKAKEHWQRAMIQHLADSLQAIPPVGSAMARAISKYYAGAFIRASILRHVISGKPFSYAQVYNDSKKEAPEVRDRIIIELLATFGQVIDKKDSILRDAATTVSSSAFTNYLQQFGKNLPGTVASEFALPDNKGNIVRLKDFRGKVVFMDFWFTGCTPCSQYYKNHVEAVHQRYAGNPQVVFLSISVDKSRERWLKSIAAGVYTVPAFINLYTNGEGEKHALIREYNIFGYPSPILIDAQGRIVTMQRDALMTRQRLVEEIEQQLALIPAKGKGHMAR